MLLATDEQGQRIVAAPGGQAHCPGCGLELVAKCGAIKSWHWAHKTSDCDPWHEHETPWHLEWKKRVPHARCEVVIGPHRADLVTAGGVVVELQHSPLAPEEVDERESFYRRERGRMVWVLDASTFGKNVEVRPLEAARAAFTWKWPRPSYRRMREQFWDFSGYVDEQFRRLAWARSSGEWRNTLDEQNTYLEEVRLVAEEARREGRLKQMAATPILRIIQLSTAVTPATGVGEWMTHEGFFALVGAKTEQRRLF